MKKTLSLLTVCMFLVTPLVHAEKRKIANDSTPEGFVNCEDFLISKSIKSCIELRPAKGCKQASFIKRGQMWMDENHSTSAKDVYVRDGEVCFDVLTSFAAKDSCCAS